MRIRWIRLVLGAIGAEIGTILLLILLVAVFGPNEQKQAEMFAQRLGLWVGPFGGALLSFLAAFWVARSSGRPLHNGALLGCFMVLFDVGLLVAMKASFEWLFVASDAGKIVAAIVGGLVAARSSTAARFS